MFRLFLLLCVTRVWSRCVWKSPSEMFPRELLRLTLDEPMFRPGRRLVRIKDDVKNNRGTRSRLPRHEAAVPGRPQYLRRNFTNGLDDKGHAYFSLLFDKRHAEPGMLYDIMAIEPPSLFRDVDLTVPKDEVEIAYFFHGPEESLEYQDHIKVWVSVRSPCLPEHEIGRVPYDFNVTATYELYHSYKNTLIDDDKAEWTKEGWISTASIIMHPPVRYKQDLFRHDIVAPCGEAWINSSLTSVNTSQFTYWDVKTRQFLVSDKFIGNLTTSIPRCHRRDQGNVCSIIARARLTYRNCHVPIAFSVRQSVSQMARLTTLSYTTPVRPSNFDASRRAPVPDHNDMRYDMWEARACEAGACTSFHIENTGLEADGDISIQQRDVFSSGYIETICTFEVVGFLDDIWSPHVYFRQWVGYDYALL